MKNKNLVIILLTLAVLIMASAMLMNKGAEFGGSDGAGSEAIEEISSGYEPWFTPVIEEVIGGEIPGEVESLLFCVQTGIGVGIIAYYMGRFVERKKYTKKDE